MKKMKNNKNVLFISFLVLWSAYSCKVEPIVEKGALVEYQYINNSNYDISLDLFNVNKTMFRQYTIKSDSILTIKYKMVFGTSPFFFGSDIKEVADSIYINFSDQRYLAYTRDFSSLNILNEMAYNCFDTSDSTRICKWVFNNETFENARDIATVE